MDLNQACQQVYDTLTTPEFERRLLQILAKERSLVQNRARRDRGQKEWSVNNLDSVQLLEVDQEIIDEKRALYSHFEEYAVAKMPQPAIISADDLQEVALSQLGGITEETAKVQLQRLIDHVLLKINEFERSKNAIDFSDWAGFESEDEYEDGPLWDDTDSAIQLANGFVLSVWIERNGLCKVNAYGVIHGVSTAMAAQRITESVGPRIASAVRSLKLAATKTELETAITILHRYDLDALDAILATSMQIEQPTIIPPAIGSLASGSNPFGTTLDYAAACILIDTDFARRINNSLELTSHADNMTNNSIALSLCVSSLEALLCCEDKNERNSEQLQKRIPALLQADQKLAENSGIAIRALYKVRNRCLHGQEVSTQHDVNAVRRLVAAVLRGVLEWAVHRNDDPVQTDDFEWRKELEVATTDKKDVKHLEGVTKGLVDHLLEFTSVFDKNRVAQLFDEDGIE
jgi:hypothetical protein